MSISTTTAELQRRQPTVVESLFYQVDELKSVAANLSKLAEYQLSQGQKRDSISEPGKSSAGEGGDTESSRQPGWPLTPPQHCQQLAVDLKDIATSISELISSGVSPLVVTGVPSTSVGEGTKGSVGGLLAALQGTTSPSEASPLPSHHHHSTNHNLNLGFKPLGVGMVPANSTNEQRPTSRRQQQLHAKPPVPKPSNVPISRPGTQQSPRTQRIGGEQHVTGGALASVQEVKRILPATLYLCLESVVKAVHAESGAIFMPRGDEMVAVVNVSTKLAFPPSLLRHMAANSLTGGVYASGVAIHQENYEEPSAAKDDNDRKLKSLLMFPIVGNGGGSRSALKKGLKPGDENRVGVIQVVNKRRGTSRFDPKDENIVCSAAFFIAQIMERHEIDWHTNYYDPITLHNLAPFVPSPAAPDLTAKQHSLGEELLKSAETAGLKVPKQDLSSTRQLKHLSGEKKTTSTTTKRNPKQDLTKVELSSSAQKIVGEDEADAELRMDDCVPKEFIPPRLIHRTTIPVSLHRRNNLKDEATMLDAAPSLLQIDSYLVNLQDCWRRAVQLNAQGAQTDQLRVAQLKRVREELNTQKKLATSLSEELRLQKLDAGDYLDEYQNLRNELQGYLERAEDHAPLATTADEEQ